MRALDWWRARPRKHKAAIIALVVYGLYGLAGYFGGSPLLRQTIVDRLSQATDRTVTLERAVFNPWALTVALEDFAFLDPDGGEFVAFERLYFDFELSSLFRWSLHFDDFELEAPRIRVTREGPGQFNVDDLLALARQETRDENAKASAPKDQPKILPVSVGNFALSRGELRYRDLSRGEPRTLVLDELDFQVRDFHTRGDGTDGNDYALAVSSPEGGRFNWTGHLTVDPLTLDGRLELSGLALGPLANFYENRLRFRLPAGELAVATDYALELGGEKLRFSLADGAITVRDLRLRQSEQEEDTLTLPELTVEGIALDSADRSVMVERLALNQPSLLARQLESGLDLQSLVVPPEETSGSERDGEEPKPAESAGAGETDPDAGSAWRFRLNELALNRARLRYRAENLRTPGELDLQPLNLTLKDLQWGGSGDFSYQGDTVLNGQGDVAFSGAGNLDPLHVDLALQADAVALKPLEPWLRDTARLNLASGQLSTELEAKASHLAEAPRVTATGSFSGEGIRILESGDRRLLQLDAFRVADIDFNLEEQSVAAGRIDLDGLHLESVVDEQGRGTAERVTLAESGTTGESAGASGSPWRVRAGGIHLRNSTLAYADYSLQPDFTFGLYQLNADIRNLDTAGTDPARVSLQADVDQYAPLSVQGQLRPDPDQLFFDLDLALQNYEMNSLTPYTGRYIGHGVQSGQLGLDTDLELTGTKLASNTDLRAQNFFLGEKVESEQAVKAPVKLGLAVLRNRDGLIRLPVNASGDLADPSVSVSGIVLKAITNVLVKAATSPFSILGDLAGGQDLDRVPFPAGSTAPDAESRERLNGLNKVLTERPTLRMKLAGSWTRADRLALARADRIQAWKPEAWTSLEGAAEQDSFQRHIRRAYRRILEQDPDALVPLAEDADRETRQAHKRKVAVQAFEALVKHGAENLPEARLKQLASERASAAKAYLVQEGGIDGGRLFLQSEPLEDQEAVEGVQVGLSAP